MRLPWHFTYPVEALCELRSKVAGLDAGGDPVDPPGETVGENVAGVGRCHIVTSNY